MEVIDWEPAGDGGAARENEGAAMTLGVFDGVHLGHKALVERVVRERRRPTVVTFRENPKRLFSPETWEGDILTFRQKREALESLGVERVIVIDFSWEFRKMRGRDFIRLLAERWNPALLAVGGNFRCGFGRDTGAADIREMCGALGRRVEVLEPVMVRGEPVSSSRIRAAVLAGDMALAGELLGRPAAPYLEAARGVWRCAGTGQGPRIARM
ncbi:MAG: putative riboflavin biosynthesis protein RibF [Treponematales bacterium]